MFFALILCVVAFISCGGRDGFYKVYEPDATGNMTCNGIKVNSNDTWEASGTDVIPFSGGKRVKYHYKGIVTKDGELEVTGGENIVIGGCDARRCAPFQFDGKEIIGCGMRFKKN